MVTDQRWALADRLFELDPAARERAGELRLVRAPGRVNLIGEHTDYNLGFVLPAAISLETWIAAVPSDDGRVTLSSLVQGDSASFELDDPGPRRGHWIDYAAGVAWSLAAEGVGLRAVRGVVDSSIPIGSGLSSSAALELAAAWTLSGEVPPPLPPMSLARAAQRAENEYVGVRCGPMDQFASTFGREGVALLLDCRSLEHRSVSLPAGHVLVALDTRSPHRLEGSQYNARREQCERAVAALGREESQIHSLRDVAPEMLPRLARLVDDETVRRVRHVVEENERVLQAASALESDDLESVGRLFAASHASLRDLYEVSSPELDRLVELAGAVPGVVGARMTGAGFGGCTVNLVVEGAVEELRRAVERGYRSSAGDSAGFHVLSAVGGAGVAEMKGSS